MILKESEIINTLIELPAWSDIFSYIIELGRELPAMPAELKTPLNKINACPGILYFGGGYAYSNTEITAGLAALVLSCGSGMVNFHTTKILGSTLYDQLSMFRKMALNEMIRRHI